MNFIVFFGMIAEVGIIIFSLSLLREERWELFKESLDHLPENLTRRLVWRRRKLVRLWWNVLAVIERIIRKWSVRYDTLA